MHIPMPSMEEKLRAIPESWQPQNGNHEQMLIGLVVDIGTRTSNFGPFPMVTILTEKGEWWNWAAFGTVAENTFARQSPEVGDFIGISYLGTAESEDYPDNPYHNWRIIIEKPSKPAPSVDKDLEPF